MAVLPNTPLPGVGGTGSIGSQIGTAVGNSFLGAVGLSSASTRQNVAGMFSYSQHTQGPIPVYFPPNASQDWRVRISLAPNATYFYNDPNNSLLSPLTTETGGGVNGIASIGNNALNQYNNATGATRVGVVFPYTPQVTIQNSANYQAQKLTHNNYTQYFYENSEVQPITITADFTVQNVTEGQYLLATIYFFRSLTKMFFGQSGYGNPPPIVYLNGYGQYYLPNVPIVVTSFSHTMPADCDYMDIPEPSVTNKNYNPQFLNYRLNSTRLPTTSSISLTVQPVYSRLAQSLVFSLTDFAAGALVNPPGSGAPTSAFGSSQTQQLGVKGIANGGFL